MGVWKKTQCDMCAVSCGIEVEVENDEIINIRPDPDSPRTSTYCCRKGRAARYFVHNEDRLNYPMKRVGDHFERISWTQAYAEIRLISFFPVKFSGSSISFFERIPN